MVFYKGNLPWNKGKNRLQIAWNKGKKGTATKASIDHLRKISIARKGTKRPPFSKEWRDNLSKAHKGKKLKESTKEKMRLRVGEKAANWQGGLKLRTNYNSKRRARIIGSGGNHTVGEWETLKAQYNWTCPRCLNKEPDIKLTEDHIIPLSKGGSDNIENIQPLCLKCNMSKFTKIIKY